MEDNYQIFESENEWEENKSPNNSYIKIKNPFIIQCSCGGDATIYQKIRIYVWTKPYNNM